MRVEREHDNVPGVHTAYESLASYLLGIRLGGEPVGLEPSAATSELYRHLVH